MDRKRLLETPLILLVWMIIGVKQICGDLLSAVLFGGGLYMAAVWIEQKILKD